MTAYSVSSDRVDACHHDREREHEEHEPREREARRARADDGTSPLPAAELREVVGAGEARCRSTAPPTANRIPTSASTTRSRRTARCAPSAIVPRCSGSMPCGKKSAPPTIISAIERTPPRRVPEDRVGAVQAEVLRRPAILDAARRVEVDLVRGQRRAEQADDEVAHTAASSCAPTCGTKPLPTCVPVRPELHGRDGEDEQAQAAVAEDPLEPLERRDPDDDRERDDGEHDQPAVRKARTEAARRSRRRRPRPRASAGSRPRRRRAPPSADLKPMRSRIASKTALPDTAATRPHISEYTMIPITPTGTTHSSW